ncbi:MAG TPA: carbon storage regulator [Firmicutes bacterium]|nr:carbon storage regulator [Bacillota bacterium]
MLVLGRKPGEFVMIGDDIMVKVVRSEKGDLRLAIHAPESVKITRGEIYGESDVQTNAMGRAKGS